MEVAAARGEEMTDTKPVARCVWCDRPLHESPTTLYWLRHAKRRKGICHECVLRLAYVVLKGMEAERGVLRKVDAALGSVRCEADDRND